MIIDDFKEILDNFEIESKKPFKNNEFASKMRNEFTDDFKDFVFNIIGDDGDYDVKISPGMVGWTNNVFYLSGAICRREQLPYPDYAYVHEFRGKVELVLEYFDSYDDEEYSTYERINLR